MFFSCSHPPSIPLSSPRFPFIFPVFLPFPPFVSSSNFPFCFHSLPTRCFPTLYSTLSSILLLPLRLSALSYLIQHPPLFSPSPLTHWSQPLHLSSLPFTSLALLRHRLVADRVCCRRPRSSMNRSNNRSQASGNGVCGNGVPRLCNFRIDMGEAPRGGLDSKKRQKQRTGNHWSWGGGRGGGGGGSEPKALRSPP